MGGGFRDHFEKRQLFFKTPSKSVDSDQPPFFKPKLAKQKVANMSKSDGLDGILKKVVFFQNDPLSPPLRSESAWSLGFGMLHLGGAQLQSGI